MTKEDVKHLLQQVWLRETGADEAFDLLESEMKPCIRGDGVPVHQLDLLEAEDSPRNQDHP